MGDEVRALPAAPTPSADNSTVFPRFTLIELQYPQGLAASAGVWVWGPAGPKYRAGLVTDAEVGGSGASLNLGLGLSTSPDTSYERSWSFGVQGVLHRTWPWGSPWLPTSTTYGGGELFVHAFAFRCSVGLLWNVSDDQLPARTVTGGCGIGTP